MQENKFLKQEWSIWIKIIRNIIKIFKEVLQSLEEGKNKKVDKPNKNQLHN